MSFFHNTALQDMRDIPQQATWLVFYGSALHRFIEDPLLRFVVAWRIRKKCKTKRSSPRYCSFIRKAHKRKLTGSHAEELATRFLNKKGHLITSRNWRSKRGEIDIISTRWQTLHIVEVKSRSYIGPDYSTTDNFSFEKRERIERLTEDFLNHYSVKWRKRKLRQIRYDLVTVTFLTGKLFGRAVISHFPDINRSMPDHTV